MHIPTNWTFNNPDIAENFDAHVIEQLPWYPMATDLICHLARCFLQDNAVLVDLGCSTGMITRKLADVIEDRNIKAVSVDNSREMIDNFQGVGKAFYGDMMSLDLYPEFDVCILCLSLMFTEVSKRKQFLRGLAAKTKAGGVIIILDKIEPPAGYLGTCINRMSIKNKYESGVEAKAIIDKELSLCGAQRPATEGLFDQFGLHFQQFFRVGDFVGYIWERSEGP